MTPQDGRGRERVRPNRPKIAAAALAGWLVGILPYLAFVSRRSSFGLWAAAGLVALAALVALWSVKADIPDATERPYRGEWLLGACSCALEGATTTILGLAFYGLTYAVAMLWDGEASPVPLAVSGAVVVVMGLSLVSLAAEKVRRTLYPPTAGTRSVFYPLLRQRNKLLAYAAAFFVAVALVAWDPGRLWTTIAATVIFVYMALPLDDLAKGVRPRTGGLADELAPALEKAGYAIVRSPRMGDPMVDPLIQNVTLLASSGDAGFAIEMAERSANAPAEWNAASAIRTAAAVLEQQEMLVEGRPLRSVQPVLVLAGGTVSPGLQRFSDAEGVRLVHLQATDGADRGARLVEALGGSSVRPYGGEVLA